MSHFLRQKQLAFVKIAMGYLTVDSPAKQTYKRINLLPQIMEFRWFLHI